MKTKMLSISLVMLMFTACVAQPTSGAPAARQEEPTSAPPTQVPEASVKIISYNILFGGGILPEWYEHINEKNLQRDRTPELFDYLRSLDPDIVALQEAYGWEDTDPPFIETAARELGLNNYYVAPSATDHDTAILTKYPIIEAESLYEAIGDPSVLRTRLQTPDGNPLNVFIVHFSPFDDEMRMCELGQLTRAAQPYFHERTILLGDFNFRIMTADGRESPETQYLKEAGYKLILRDSTLNRDHLWMPGDAPPWKSRSWFDLPETTLSDHSPIGTRMDFYPYDSKPLETETQITTAFELPDFLTELVNNSKTIGSTSFEDPCMNKRWFPNEPEPRFQYGTYIIPGAADWMTNTIFPGNIRLNQGILARFKVKEGSELSLYLSTGGQWGDDSYREIGLYFPFEEIKPFGTVGLEPNFSSETPFPKLEPGHNYWIALMLAADGRVMAALQDAQDPATSAYLYEYEKMDSSLLANDWFLNIGANKGVMTIDDYARFTFDSLK